MASKLSEPSIDGEREVDWYLQDTHQENISFRKVAPVDVKIRNLFVNVGSARSLSKFKQDEEAGAVKTILSHIDADFPRGSLTGIMGSSGSGKTTMLNVLAHRMRSTNLSIHGLLTYNNSPALKSISHAYVTQTDILLPTLSVRETLMYAADLRLPSSVSRAQRAQLVEEIILELGLKECADTFVGDGHRKRGCSGGERRRVSLGVQMLSNPSVLFLDEPTTGLDATSALQLVKTLKSLAGKGRTIIVTIHQPRSDIFLLLDRVTLLAQGNVVYSGPTSESLTWFDHFNPGGLKPHVNPADYLVDMAAIDSRTLEAEQESHARVDRLVAAWKSEAAQRFDEPLSKETLAQTCISQDDEPHGGKAPVTRTIVTLIKRSMKTTIRDPLGLSTSWIEAILMGLVVGLVFFNVDDTLSGIRSRQAALYISVGLQGYLMLMYEVYRLTIIEMPVFDREHGEGVVGVLPFLISYRFAHFVFEDVLVPLLFSVITFFLIGFQRSAGVFFVYFAVALLNQFASVTFAVVAASISREFAVATLIANLAFTVHSFACGFFVQADSIPVYLRWMKWCSHTFYAFTALVENEFRNQFYSCPLGDAHTNPNCLAYQGNFIIKSLAVPQVGNGWTILPICVMLSFTVFYVVASALLLQFKPVDITVAKGRKSNAEEPKGKEQKIISRGARKLSEDINVELVDYSLQINTRGKKEPKKILNGITTRFEAGKVNVILGPSGSGKSSLLNLMAGRMQSTLTTKYEQSGLMTLNGVTPPDKTIRILCSYVTQDDAALLPYLTVRETLRFAAGLRLPKWMSKADKIRKAEEILLKMGLKDCADTLIGNEWLKGISGGEKRRVSIAVQVLTEPHVLMLDEPTSGLDAFTASSIMEVLSQLAAEGRTIITTIHQSRSDLFPHFGNVLLLVKGGKVAYSGATSDMLRHMSSIGFKCPSTMNPADFALDVVSVDLRNKDQEEASRIKVEKLVDAFRRKLETEKHLSRNSSGQLPDVKSSEFGISPITTALPILLHRGWLAFKRQKSVGEARFGNVLGLAVVTALFFAPLKTDYISVQNRVGCVQEVLALYFAGILQNVAVYPIERDVFYREYADGAYSVESFFLSYTILELPCEIISCLIYAVLVATAANLRRTVAMFFITAINAVCILNAGESLGIVFNTILRDSTGLALNLTNVFLSIANFMAGLMSVDMPDFFEGINYLSPLRYVVRNLMPYSLRNLVFTCEDFQRLPDGTCPINDGADVLAIYNLERTNPAINLGITIALMVIYRLIAYIFLKVAKAQFKIERKK